VARAADFVRDIADVGRMRQIASDARYSGVINCAVGNQRPVSAPDRGFENDLQTGLVGASNIATAFYDTLKKTKGTLVNIGSDLSLKARLTRPSMFRGGATSDFADTPSAKQETRRAHHRTNSLASAEQPKTDLNGCESR